MALFPRTCIECGVDFEAQKAWAEFCCKQHRQDFDNRQGSRGGELYAFAMNWRYGEGKTGTRRDGTSLRKRDKEAAATFWKLLEAFHSEDEHTRKNRPTYRPTRTAMAKLGGNRGGLTRLPGCDDGRSPIKLKREG
jgi:hypothetical protein